MPILPPSLALKNRAFVLESGHVIPGIAKLQEYLLGVLAKFWSQGPKSGWRLAELDGAVHDFELHARLVFHFGEEAVLPSLRIMCYLERGLDAPQNQVEFLCN